ncbi:MAG: serine/threonine-protein kinase, partial [Acidobacteriota bacterium]
MIGETISHFRILEKIDEGGMGVIYKARDEKLHRDVAIKILAPKLVEDQDMRDRFLREARSAAAMAHPNIAIIYEVDEADRGIFIAMELVEGETLEAILKRSGSLPLGNLLDLAIQTVEGLAEAHSRKIIHMDLKPQNLMVTPGGRVKILDFGLARPFREEAPAGTEAVDAETVILDSPNNRRISGTIQYMSPEQSLGIPVDARSDLFTFGTMLYEMSTGRKPFQGGSVTSTIAKILEADPDPFSRVKADLPVGLEHIVLKCLEKKPADRYQEATDLL